MTIEKISAAEFDSFIQGEHPVLIDFYADWCGPCRMLAPELEKLAQLHPELRCGKVNVDEAGQLAMRFGIASIPYVALFRNGKMVAHSLGYMTAKTLESALGL